MSATSTAPSGGAHPFEKEPRVRETVVYNLLRGAGAVSILTTAGIVFILFNEAFRLFMQDVSFVEFLTDPTWRPFGNPESESFQLGILALIQGTLMVTFIAMLIAIPLGLASAIYLSEYAGQRVRKFLKPTLEVLAGVPTVVLGYFALTAMTPVLRSIFGTTVDFFNPASAGIVMGIMIVPTVASLSEDAMTAVPASLRMGAYGLGATKRQVVTQVVFPAALSGIVAAIILGIGRGVGETMIVAIAGGNQPIDFSADPAEAVNPFKQVQTMTAYIVQAVQGETPRGSPTYRSIFAVGATLFLMTLSLNVAAQRFVRRFRESY